eukprot:TRINITY_DN23938_c0_g1_i3.p1 TRINITY_DN23938_c0_g1~~TRINITY_DN23938_c0_g1_i3.p1  ORF type:complete len:351 (-),score=53.69 TRINITY_DN23938_c0_g1_i3:63-1094(-)
MAHPEWKKWIVGSLAACTEEAEYNAILRTVPRTPNPTSLAEFGYRYNERGELRHVDTNKPFAWLGQKHYDAIGDIIVKHIQDLMKEEGLIEEFIPSLECESRCNIFRTPDALTNPDRLMLLIQGSGAVRAGQWARALCINATLEQGTILPYLKRAREAGFGVIVFNPNFNAVPAPLPPQEFEDPFQFWLGTPDAEWKKLQQRREAHATPIPGSTSPEEHTVTVWDMFGAKAAARAVVIVAHSYGGINTLALLRDRERQIEPRLKGIALTDALQKSKYFTTPLSVQKIMARTSLNWVASNNPLDSPEPSKFNYKRVSAGHDTHEYTSSACIESVFRWLEEKLAH